MRRRDWLGIAAVAVALAGLMGFREVFVEPRVWGVLCAAASAPAACAPRAALLWLQQYGLWGLGGLALGLWAFLGGPFAVAVGAVAMGTAGVVNYNVSLGMLGAAIGAWAWLSRDRAATPPDAGAAAAGPRAARRTESIPSTGGSQTSR